VILRLEQNVADRRKIMDISAEQPTRCDVIIRGGVVIDGTGAPRYSADVAVSEDRIVAVGELSGIAADHEVLAEGAVVAPGFIDVHTHDDGALLAQPEMTPKISQGVTTVIAGNCGFSLAPLRPRAPLAQEFRYLGEDSDYRFDTMAAYVAAFEAAPATVNAALLVGHSTLRAATMDDLDRPASDREIASMRALLREAIDSGASGFSTGLEYPTNRAATTAEIVAVAEEMAATGGIYTTHYRDYVYDIDGAMEEAFEIGRRAGVQVHLSHHQLDSIHLHGRADQTLRRIDRARVGQSVSLDVYPYTAGGGAIMEEFVAVAKKVVITRSAARPDCAGRDLSEIARDWGCSPVEAAGRLKPGGAIYFLQDEEDMRRILSYRHTSIGSDSLPFEPIPHPRLWGTFPRVLGHYARDLGLFTMEEAVHRMTGLAAAQFGFVNRGVVRPGAYADLVVFDAERVIDRATYEEPERLSEGIVLVMVNGIPVWRNGVATGERSGRIVRREIPI
jgi:N-acyl-D-amino-acid deacylase